MDEIIGLLFLVVPVLFSLIGKKLEKADDGKKAQPVRPVAPVRPAQEAQRSTLRPQRLKSELQENVMKVPSHAHADANANAYGEKESHKRSERVDPKKLVIYSEIMKPKFKD